MTVNVITPNQCDNASSHTDDLQKHLKTHSGEKLNKCNQCDYASYQAVDLRTHLKRHSGEKSNKCNQCDYASSDASTLRRHLKRHSGENTKQMPVWLYIIWCKRFEDTFENTPWSQIKQMQPMWLCIFSGIDETMIYLSWIIVCKINIKYVIWIPVLTLPKYTFFFAGVSIKGAGVRDAITLKTQSEFL